MPEPHAETLGLVHHREARALVERDVLRAIRLEIREDAVRLGAIQVYFADPTGGVTSVFDLDGVSGGPAFESVEIPANLP